MKGMSTCFKKMAAIYLTGKHCDGRIARYLLLRIPKLCAKCEACTTQFTLSHSIWWATMALF